MENSQLIAMALFGALAFASPLAIAEDQSQRNIHYCGEIRTVIIIASEMKYDKKSPQQSYAIKKMRDLQDVPAKVKKYLINQVYFAPELSQMNPYTAGDFGTQVYMSCLYSRRNPQPKYQPLK